ncbi:MAG: histidinol-phosphatase [Lachnospiraceae bacterium]|nr:histidinol-phosphatase [Lachnospiraceae bacterium]
MLANYHTHTVRCHHAQGSEREYIEEAIKKGFKILGFSDHVPQPYPATYTSGCRMAMTDLPDYVNTLLALKEEYKKDITLYIGFEAEYSIKYFDKLIKELSSYPIDYLIQGQHFVPDEVEGFYAGAKTDDVSRLKDYVNCTIEGMETGLFSYLAHPDVINFTGDREIYKEEMAKVVETANRLNLPLEVNMYGFTDNRHYPSDTFFTLASELGAKFVLGCDAHNPKMMLRPEDIPGFNAFLEKNNIKTGDNMITLNPVK